MDQFKWNLVNELKSIINLFVINFIKIHAYLSDLRGGRLIKVYKKLICSKF